MKVSFKYLLALMGALVLGLLFQSGALAATEVRTREDLEAIANNCNGDFVLVADIDLSDAPWEPINWFGGTLDGANHIITGMHIEGSYHDCNIGLFDQVAGTISRLNINGLQINVNVSGSFVTATAFGLPNDIWTSDPRDTAAHIINCRVSGRATIQAASGTFVGMSPLAGAQDSTATFDVNLSGDTLSERLLWNSVNCQAEGNAAINGGNNCTSNASVYSDQLVGLDNCKSCRVGGSMENAGKLDTVFITMIRDQDPDGEEQSANRCDADLSYRPGDVTPSQFNLRATLGPQSILYTSVKLDSMGSSDVTLVYEPAREGDEPYRHGAIEVATTSGDIDIYCAIASDAPTVGRSGSGEVKIVGGSSNSAEVSGESNTGSVGAIGGQRYNSGNVTVVVRGSGFASATGVSGDEGYNSGAVSATSYGSGEPGAYGATGSNGWNEGEVTSVHSVSGDASAIGSRRGVNMGSVLATTTNGNATAFGLEYGTYNGGDVTARGSGEIIHANGTGLGDGVSVGTVTANNTSGETYVVANGEVRNVLLIAVRGTVAEEWIGNFNVIGEDSNFHDDFRQCANSVENRLTQYHLRYKYDPATTRTFLCGHSRAGAVVDLVAHDMNVGALSSLTGDLTAYTFAAPNSTKTPAPDSNIFNYVYKYDFVPFVPHRGFGKYGLNLIVGGDTPSSAPESVKTAFYNYTHGTPYKGVGSELIIQAILASDEIRSVLYGATMFQRAWGYLELTLAGFHKEGGNFIARAHGAENYLSWVKYNGTAGAQSLEQFEENEYNHLTTRLLSVTPGIITTVFGPDDPLLSEAMNVMWQYMPITYPNGATVIGVGCPVDVELLDSSGRELGRLADHHEQAMEDEVLAMGDGSASFLFIPTGTRYTLRITATGDGTMTVDYAYFRTGSECDEAETVVNVPVHSGEVFLFEADAESGNIPVLISSDGQAYFPESFGISFRLPAGLERIEDEAFLDDAGITGFLSLPVGLESIGSAAFRGTDIMAVYIPNSVREIAVDAFGTCHPTIYCRESAYAASWADDNGFQWVRLP